MMWNVIRGLIVMLLALGSMTSLRAADRVSVYQCVVAGQRIFSDQPCAPDAQQREIGESNRMDAQDTSILARPESSTKPRPSSNDDTDKKKATCNKVREQQAQIEAQQRAGYTAKQGERLRARHDKLAEQYASLKCERYR